MRDLLTRLRKANRSRVVRWHGPDSTPWTGADWSNAMCGEAGEAANVVKKLRRFETGTRSKRDDATYDELRGDLREELADMIVYADLLAIHYGLDLREGIIAKFDKVSEREGFPERLSPTQDEIDAHHRDRPHGLCAAHGEPPGSCSDVPIAVDSLPYAGGVQTR